MAKEEKKDKNNKNKKHFFKDLKAELKKVIWPTPKQLFNNTIAVVTIVIITAVLVLVLDLSFEAMNKYGINNIKKVVESSSVENTQLDDNTTEEQNIDDTENAETDAQDNDLKNDVEE